MPRKLKPATQATYTDARNLPKSFDETAANPDEFAHTLEQRPKPKHKGRTVFPTETADDVDDLRAKARAKRLELYAGVHYNRLQLRECIMAFNAKIRERYKGQPAEIKRHTKTKTYLAAVLFPDTPIGTAISYLSEWDNGGVKDERLKEPLFKKLSPRAIITLCNELECSPNDLFNTPR